MLTSVKCFFYIYWDNHIVFLLQSVSIPHYIDFKQLILHSQDKLYLVMMVLILCIVELIGRSSSEYSLITLLMPTGPVVVYLLPFLMILVICIVLFSCSVWSVWFYCFQRDRFWFHWFFSLFGFLLYWFLSLSLLFVFFFCILWTQLTSKFNNLDNCQIPWKYTNYQNSI